MNNLLTQFPNLILLSNLIKIRWIAISGQLFTIFLVYFYFKIEILIFFCIIVVLISTLLNLLLFYFQKKKNNLNDKEFFYILLFDTIQLAILLSLTGGIYNPFSLLLIAPLIISASYLKITFSIIHLMFSILTVFFLSFFYLELNFFSELNIPRLWTYGLVFSLITALIFIAIYVYVFARSSRSMSAALDQTKHLLSNQKKITEIGSLSAAAVHELSTPINTIFLILDDLMDVKMIKKNNNIKNDFKLLKSQAEKCKQILLSLSENPQNMKDNFFDKTTLSNIIKLNFDKFNEKNIKLIINIATKENEPLINFKDELMYGIGNIIQNAVQHAENLVETDIIWDNQNINLIIKDDGLGFSKEVLDKIGNPYISSKKIKGMGLGIFIAKNLIENMNSKIKFSNQNDNQGSLVEINLNINNLLK